jgi:hypothetical protein
MGLTPAITQARNSGSAAISFAFKGLRLALIAWLAFPCAAFAGGPRWVAGSSYFDPAALGKPVLWQGGVLNYYTDQGGLSSTVTQAQANALVASAAAIWTGVPTAAISITAAGSLAEDVNGSNVTTSGGLVTAPADIVSTATQTPIAIVYDFDGAVTDALLGPGASDPIACLDDGVTLMVDGMSTAGNINHTLMILNGLCATPDKMALMQYLITRAFGQTLGLDWSQANEGIFDGSIPWNSDSLAGWPLMHPIERLCNSSGGACMPEALSLRPDDIATLSRLYPVTAANIADFTGKSLTAASTISIQGTISFRSGQGMQGVNVVAQPLIAGTSQRDLRYTATTVSGALFQGDAGNPVTGTLDDSGNPLNQFGGNNPAVEGTFDLSGIALPAGLTQSDYQLTFEPVSALDTGTESVGPYALGQVTPSGTMPVIVIRGLEAGTTTIEDVTIQDSAEQLGAGSDGVEDTPANLPGNGEWLAKLDGYGHSSWFRWHIRGGRQFSIETQALDEHGKPSADKARPVLGIWDGTDATGVRPANPIISTLQPFNGDQVGLTLMRVETYADADVRLAVADQRGDGRPDYLYRGRVLYADSVTPQRMALAGGAVTIRGVGFRPENVVTVNGVAAAILSLTSTEISAIVPAAGAGVTGGVDVTVTDPATQGAATIEAGLSYDAGNTDSIETLAAPVNTVPMDVPLAFTVKTVGADGATPAGGLTVTYTVTSGIATLGCGTTTCSVVSSGDGLATLSVTATSAAAAVVTASLLNGASVQTNFSGSAPPQIAALSPTLYVAAGATFSWSPTALVLSAGSPSAGKTVNWTGGSGIAVTTPSTVSNAQGLATGQLVVGPLGSAVTVQVNACLAGGAPNCAVFSVASVNPALASLVAVSGTDQTLSDTGTPAPGVLRVEDAAGHAMAGAVVNFYESLTGWQAGCPSLGRCPGTPVLATQTVQAVSGADGLVVLTPLIRQGTGTMLQVLAVTGSESTLAFQIE